MQDREEGANVAKGLPSLLRATMRQHFLEVIALHHHGLKM
jgi:hypothetical protein